MNVTINGCVPITISDVEDRNGTDLATIWAAELAKGADKTRCFPL